MSQRELVYKWVCHHLSKELGETIDETNSNLKALLEKFPDVRKEIHCSVYYALKYGYPLKCVPDNLISYTEGLINNWLRKDLRLNGGERYCPTRGRPLSTERGDILAPRPESESESEPTRECTCKHSLLIKGCECGAIKKHDPNKGWYS